MADLEFAQRLRDLAGWNQTDQDWRRLLRLNPDGCFLAELDGQPAGTATTTVYAGRLAWIGMVLVDPQCRRRGVATQLMRHSLHWLLERARVRCVKLDATPAGRAVYRRLGFHDEYSLSRWTRQQTQTRRAVGERDEAAPRTISRSRGSQGTWESDARESGANAEALTELDRQAFGIDRRVLLEQLANDSQRVLAGESGFAMRRPGVKADYLGPITLQPGADGQALLAPLIATATRSTLYWDIPDDNTAAVALATRLGFRQQRQLFRMWTGPACLGSEPTLQWGIAGPELG